MQKWLDFNKIQQNTTTQQCEFHYWKLYARSDWRVSDDKSNSDRYLKCCSVVAKQCLKITIGSEISSRSSSNMEKVISVCWFQGTQLAIAWPKPLYQSEVYCRTIHVKMTLICMWMKSHFHMKGWAPALALRKRLQGIQKSPVVCDIHLEMVPGCWILKFPLLHH